MSSFRRSSRFFLLASLAILLTSCIPFIRIRIHKESEATLLARKIAPALARIEARLDRQPSPPSQKFLEEIHADIERALAGPQLAAARDYILENGEPQARGAALPKSRSRLARFAQDPAPAGLAARIAEVRRRAEKNDLLISICAETNSPDPSTFRLWPQSYPRNLHETKFPGVLQVYRGLYAYRATSRGGDRQSERKIECDRSSERTCPRLDLMTDSRPGLLCDFDSGACSRQAEFSRSCDL